MSDKLEMLKEILSKKLSPEQVESIMSELAITFGNGSVRDDLDMIKKILSKKLLPEQVESLISELVIAFGNGSVAIKGDATEAVILTGNQNIIGDNNHFFITPKNEPIQFQSIEMHKLEMRKKLEDFYDDPNLNPFKPRLKILIEDVVFLPQYSEVCEIIIKIFQGISQDSYKRQSLQSSVIRANQGAYIQPNSSEKEIFERNRDFISHFIGKTVPIVTLIMNTNEALELTQEMIFTKFYYPENLLNYFRELQVILEKNLLADWINRYKQTPEEWQPFDSDSDSISKIVSQILDQPDLPLFIPIFIDIRVINEPQNRNTLKQLREHGCILIIDSISIQHPKLFKAFHQSALDINPKTSVITLVPNDTIDKTIQNMIGMIQLSNLDMEISKRQNDIGEFGKCQKSSNKIKFQQWLRHQIDTVYISRNDHKQNISSLFFQNYSSY